MRFKYQAGQSLGLVEAAALGRPAGGEGPYLPTGEDDLSSLIYAPQSTFSDFAASAVSALFPGDIDPMLALRLAEKAFPSAPNAHPLDDNLTILDLATGPSASSADAGTSFLGGILAAEARASGARIVLADGSGPEGAALAEAMSGIEGLSLALLYPRLSRAAGIRPARLERAGGATRLIAVRGGPGEVRALLAAAAGRRFGDRAVTVAGPSNPARLAARIIGCAAIFASLRKGATGEFYLGLRADDGVGLAACLWAWRLGVPLTGAVLPLLDASGRSTGAEAAFVADPDGRALASRLEEGRPGLIPSLVRLPVVDDGRILEARELLEKAGGPPADRGSTAAIAAATAVLDQGLRGHAKIIVLSERHPCWSEEGGVMPEALRGAMLDARPDEEIDATLEDLEGALTR
jgi:threonine synthase